MKKEIRALVQTALADNPRHDLVEIGSVTHAQAVLFRKYVPNDLQGVTRILDTSGIRHALKEHGSQSKEAARGQVAINTDDFLLLPDILKFPDSINYLGKNSLKQDVFIYEKRIEKLYFVAEAIRISKRGGDKLVFQTMYKRK